MADEELLQKVQSLGDLDLAALLCLISREHCVISTEPESLDELTEELQHVSSQTFGLRATVVDCTPHTTLDDFAAAIQLPRHSATPRSTSPFHARTTTDSYFHAHHGSHAYPPARALSPLTPASATPGHYNGGGHGNGNGQRIANVILARNLDRAPRAVQIQALELLRTRRIFTRTSVLAAPKQFLLVAVLGAPSGGRARLTEHLNDFFYVAHWHDPEDGFPHLEEEEEEEGDGAAADDADDAASVDSGESVVRRSASGTPGLSVRSQVRWDPVGDPLFSEGDVAALAALSCKVSVDVEVLRYQMNIVSFLRMDRNVGGGISPVATKHYDQLIKSLAVLHGLDYATPSLVGLAAKKIYLHRIRIVTPQKERSMQWGSQLGAVEAMLDDVGPEDVIEDVLELVAAPV